MTHIQHQLKHLKRQLFFTEYRSIELKVEVYKSVRQKMLEEVGPELGSFFFQQYQELKQENPEK